MRPGVGLCFLAGCCLLPACVNRLTPLGPTPPGEGITIYIHTNYVGSSQALNADVADLKKVEGPCGGGQEGQSPTWSDCISSVRVVEGWSATLYRDRNFTGESITLTSDTPNLRDVSGPCDGSFNDCVSSIRVSRQ